MNGSVGRIARVMLAALLAGGAAFAVRFRARAFGFFAFAKVTHHTLSFVVFGFKSQILFLC